MHTSCILHIKKFDGRRMAALLGTICLLLICAQNAQAQEDILTIYDGAGTAHIFTIEKAETDSTRAGGLMFRNEMPANHGMLFIFEGEEERNFWMKNTLIPLDMIFITADKTIHRIHENAQPHDLTRVYSKGPVKYVLELNGGTVKRLGLKEGDTVRF